MNDYKVVVNKSTDPFERPDKKVKEITQNILKDRKLNYKYSIESSPEFLREGKALYDSTHPDSRIL